MYGAATKLRLGYACNGTVNRWLTILVCRITRLRDCVLQQEYEVPVHANTPHVEATAAAHNTLRGGRLLQKRVNAHMCAREGFITYCT